MDHLKKFISRKPLGFEKWFTTHFLPHGHRKKMSAFLFPFSTLLVNIFHWQLVIFMTFKSSQNWTFEFMCPLDQVWPPSGTAVLPWFNGLCLVQQLIKPYVLWVLISWKWVIIFQSWNLGLFDFWSCSYIYAEEAWRHFTIMHLITNFVKRFTHKKFKVRMFVKKIKHLNFLFTKRRSQICWFLSSRPVRYLLMDDILVNMSHFHIR